MHERLITDMHYSGKCYAGNQVSLKIARFVDGMLSGSSPEHELLGEPKP